MTAPAPALLEYVARIARLTKHGEKDDDGHAFEMVPDDAVDTLHALIDAARALTAEIGGT